MGKLLQPNSSITQVWAVTRHRWGISAHVPQTSFPGETNCAIAKWRFFSPATGYERALHRFRIRSMASGKRQFVPRFQVFPVLIVHYSSAWLLTRTSNDYTPSLLLERSSIAFTANVNLYHVTTFYIYLSFTAHYNYSKIGRFTPILSITIVLNCFDLLISPHFSFWKIEKVSQFESHVCRLP